jgi:LysM repeat protein
MLNFVQPKVISQNTTTTSVESQIPIRKDPVANYQQGPKYVIHKVNPNDTLDRISIIYNVPKDAIRKANDFIGDEIYMKKELIIPDSCKLLFFS